MRPNAELRVAVMPGGKGNAGRKAFVFPAISTDVEVRGIAKDAAPTRWLFQRFVIFPTSSSAVRGAQGVRRAPFRLRPVNGTWPCWLTG